jgi:MinD superfamily P-loop ATPase
LKEITVISGKGGTGKTTITASFAVLAKGAVMVDCDVDASDLHLLLNPRIIHTYEFKGPRLASIDKAKCVQCGICEEVCKFNAINDFTVDPILCEGCGVCVFVCPEEAVLFEERISGHAFISETKYGPMSHARLNPGEENSGKLVSLVRENAKRLAREQDYELILNDGSPGIGCPVIASIANTDAGLIVVEPTLSGIHDLQRAISLLNHFQIPALVCVNKYDINTENTKAIRDFCTENEIILAGTTPFDPVVTKSMVAGKPVVEYCPEDTVSKEIAKTWKRVVQFLDARRDRS